MRVKLFRAREIGAAMARIRAELGPEALILSSRRVADGVEVTAALEPTAPEPPDPRPTPEREPIGRAALLVWHGVPARLAAALAAGKLPDALAGTLRFGALPLDPTAPPLLLIGPPGAGKTLTAARLATRLVLAGGTPRLITADGERAGAIEQLAAFTRLLGLDLLAAGTVEAFARALGRARAGGPGPILVDTPGFDLLAPAGRAALGALAEAADGHIALVLPGGMDPAESAEIAAAGAEAGARFLLATRLDQARRLGGVLAAAESGGLTLTEAGIGPGAADGLTPLTPALLADALARGAARAAASPHPAPPHPAPPHPGPPHPAAPAPAPPIHARPVWPRAARLAPLSSPVGHANAPIASDPA